MPDFKTPPRKRPTGVIVVAVAAIIFGLGEIWVGLFGNYLGILARNMPPSIATAIVGGFYSLGGLALLITRRTWGTILGLLFIGAEVLGRIYLVAVGIAPSSGSDLLKIVIGGAIAIGFMSYIAWRSFSQNGA
jgi:hypothetical protein